MDQWCVGASQQSNLLSHSLCELLGFLRVRSVLCRHLSCRSWHSSGLSARSALNCRLKVETDRWRCLNFRRFDGYYFYRLFTSISDNNAHHSKRQRDFMSHDALNGHWITLYAWGRVKIRNMRALNYLLVLVKACSNQRWHGNTSMDGLFTDKYHSLPSF